MTTEEEIKIESAEFKDDATLITFIFPRYIKVWCGMSVKDALDQYKGWDEE